MASRSKKKPAVKPEPLFWSAATPGAGPSTPVPPAAGLILVVPILFIALLVPSASPLLADPPPRSVPDSEPVDRSRPSESLTADPLARQSKMEERWLKTALNAEPGVEQNEGRIGIENAAEGEWIQGEEDGQNVMKLYGRIRLRIGSGYLLADRVIIDTNRKEIYAEGNLLYVEGNARVKADRMIYDQRLGAGILYNGEGYRQPLYFTGKNMRGLGEGKFSISHAWFTSCAAKAPHYEFRARRLWVYRNDRVVAVGVMYYVGGVPVLPLPFFYASEWGTGVISQFGRSKLSGFFWQNTYQFAVPTAITSSFLPMAYRVQADTYEKKGNQFGLEMYRFAPGLSYVLDLGYAEYKRYQVVTDTRTHTGFSVSNRMLHSDGTYGPEILKWKKAFALMSWQGKDYEKNSVQKFSLRYEDYTHRLYEFEYGGRYQPETTIPALYKGNDAGRGIPRNTTEWNLSYTDQRDDMTLSVKANQFRTWYERPVFTESSYEPVRDILPSVKIDKKIDLGRFDTPFHFYWDHQLASEVRRDYQIGVPYQTRNENQYKTGFRGYFTFYPYVTFRPYAGFGIIKTTSSGTQNLTTTGQPIISTTDQAVLTSQAKRDSYEYYFQEHELSLGPQEFYLRSVYRKKDAFAEEEKDASRSAYTGFKGRQRVNEDEISLNANPLEDLNFQILSVYDFRSYGHTVQNRDRWSYPVFRTDLLINLLNPLRPAREYLLGRRKSHFLNVRFINDYVYNPVMKERHSNLSGVVIQMGGFDLWLLERLRYFEMGYYWYHVYNNPSLDHMRYHSKLDIRLTKMFYFEMQMESRLTRPDRYVAANYSAGVMCRTGRCLPPSMLPESEQQTSLGQDFVNGLGLNGDRARENAAFNIGFFEGALLVDLHDWEMRFGYSAEQKAILAGVNSYDVVNFYDNKVFFSATFLRFDVGGISQRPSRFILNRQRVRSQDMGRTPVSAQ